MKKLFLLLMAFCLSLTMSAQVAYLLPNDCSYNSENGNLDGFISENQNGVDQWPELNAAVWFRDNYVRVANPTGVFISGADFATNHDGITALWVHIDRVGLSSEDCRVKMGGDAFVNALRDFVKAGGNLLVSKQATRLIGDIGRGDYPEYNNGGYDKTNEQWFIATNFAERSNTGHYIYHEHNGGISESAPGNLESAWVRDAGFNTCTDHNCGYAPAVFGMANNADYTALHNYENNHACRVLGTWGGCTDMPYAGMMEFYPQGDYKGTILMYGLATYMWLANNRGWGGDNIRFITKSALSYLSNTPNGKNTPGKKLVDIFAEDWCYPTSLATNNNEFRTIHPDIDGWSMSSWVREGQRSTANIVWCTDKDKLVFYQEGTVQLYIKVTEDREFQAWPKGDYEFVRDITFSYKNDPTPQGVADADLSSNGLQGEEGKFMLLHPNMRGMDSLAYAISFDGIDEAQRAEVKKIKDDGATRLAFTKAGTVKLNIRLNEPNFREEWAKGEHNVTKTVTFAQPAFSWSHTPDVAAIGEDKDPVAATCTNVPGITAVQYESDNAEVASIDAETGKITYIKQGTCNVYAYITINGITFRSEAQAVTVNGLNIVWTTEPAESAFVGDDMTILAAPEYGVGTVQYEVSGCTYSDGQLHFTEAGTATVRPYVVAGGETYYGEEKSISVTVRPTTTVYERTVTPGRYGTICLERTSTALEGATFFWPAYKNVADGEVAYIVLEEVTVLKAGYGYFFLPTASTIRVSMSLTEEALPAPVDDGETTHGMHGNFTGTLYVPDFDGGLPNEYILSNNTLVYGTGNTIGEHRAYLKMSEVPEPQDAPAPVPGRKRVNMAVQQPPHTPTAIENMTENGSTTKTLINGQVVIRKNGVNYNVLGTKL